MICSPFGATFQFFCNTFATFLQLLCNPFETPVQILCSHFVAPVQSLCVPCWNVSGSTGMLECLGPWWGDPTLDQPLSEPSAAVQQDALIPGTPYGPPSSIPPLQTLRLPFSSLLKDREHV